MSFLKRWLFRTKTSKTGYDDIMRKLSVTPLKDERFAIRVELYGEFCQFITECGKMSLELEPEKIVDKTAEQTHDVNNKLYQAAIPFGRGGDKDKNWYSEMIGHWSDLYEETVAIVDDAKSIIKKYDERKGHKIDVLKRHEAQKLRFFFNTVFLKRGLKVASWSWFGVDVTPQWIGAIVTAPQPYGYPPTTMQQPRSLEDALQQEQKTQNWGSPKYLDKKEDSEGKEE